MRLPRFRGAEVIEAPPTAYRAVLVLRDIEGLSNHEAAEILGTTSRGLRNSGRPCTVGDSGRERVGPAESGTPMSPKFLEMFPQLGPGGTCSGRGIGHGRVTEGRLRLRSVREEILEAILLVEVPRSLRLILVVVLVLLAYGTGLVWSLAIGYQHDAVRVEQRQEVLDLRNQVRHLWGAFEYVKTGLDGAQLDGRPRPTEPREGSG